MLKFKLIKLKRLLSRVKGSIRLVMQEDPRMRYRFSQVWADLESAGVKDQFDSGEELDNFLWRNNE